MLKYSYPYFRCKRSFPFWKVCDVVSKGHIQAFGVSVWAVTVAMWDVVSTMWAFIAYMWPDAASL